MEVPRRIDHGTVVCCVDSNPRARMPPTVHILGAGGIGIAAAMGLVRAGWQVTMVESNPA